MCQDTRTLSVERTCAQDELVATAGDLLRKALDEGVSEYRLARELADGDADQKEVERWRFVVRRAASGSEPSPGRRRRIADYFGKRLDEPKRQVKKTGRPGEREGEVADLMEATRALVRVVTELCGAVEAMGAALPLDAIEELSRAGLRIQPGVQRR